MPAAVVVASVCGLKAKWGLSLVVMIPFSWVPFSNPFQPNNPSKPLSSTSKQQQ